MWPAQAPVPLERRQGLIWQPGDPWVRGGALWGLSSGTCCGGHSWCPVSPDSCQVGTPLRLATLLRAGLAPPRPASQSRGELPFCPSRPCRSGGRSPGWKGQQERSGARGVRWGLAAPASWEGSETGHSLWQRLRDPGAWTGENGAKFFLSSQAVDSEPAELEMKRHILSSYKIKRAHSNSAFNALLPLPVGEEQQQGPQCVCLEIPGASA